jgi:hypothetical protein
MFGQELSSQASLETWKLERKVQRGMTHHSAKWVSSKVRLPALGWGGVLVSWVK